MTLTKDKHLFLRIVCITCLLRWPSWLCKRFVEIEFEVWKLIRDFDLKLKDKTLLVFSTKLISLLKERTDTIELGWKTCISKREMNSFSNNSLYITSLAIPWANRILFTLSFRKQASEENLMIMLLPLRSLKIDKIFGKFRDTEHYLDTDKCQRKYRSKHKLYV